jgi:hypothetical protein
MTFTLEIQKQRAKELWLQTCNCVEKLKNDSSIIGVSNDIKSVIDDIKRGFHEVDVDIREKLHAGKVPPIFHAYCALVWRLSPVQFMPRDKPPTLVHLFVTETVNDKSVLDSTLSGLSGNTVSPSKGNSKADPRQLRNHKGARYQRCGPESIVNPHMSEFFTEKNKAVGFVWMVRILCGSLMNNCPRMWSIWLIKMQ